MDRWHLAWSEERAEQIEIEVRDEADQPRMHMHAYMDMRLGDVIQLGLHTCGAAQRLLQVTFHMMDSPKQVPPRTALESKTIRAMMKAMKAVKAGRWRFVKAIQARRRELESRQGDDGDQGDQGHEGDRP